MAAIPAPVQEFLAAKRIAVAGVSRSGNQPANAIFKRLRDTGHDAIPVNPAADELEGTRCYRDVAAIPAPLDALMVVTHPRAAADVVRAALDRGVKHVWFHRSFGDGRVAEDAVALCRAKGVEPIVGGCPLMYCGNVDPAHRVFRAILRWSGRVPG